ncbi:MAG: transcription elongation factor GreA [Candidatus Staskawiczbacteria bacterium]|nr:transcription elongation factor GreA [Candidatus Staskawiczbacteria bacterium]
MSGKVFYVTKEKLQELKKEYEELVASERHKTIGEEAPKILESEDVNPEFISFQEDMDTLRSRISFLEEVFEDHEIIKKPSKENQVFVDIGAKVKLETNGKNNDFMIVGTLEANPDVGKISNESPVGKALLGRKVGEEVVINSPEKRKYKIKNISYEIS